MNLYYLNGGLNCLIDRVGIINFIDNSECPVCLENKKCIVLRNCEHFMCICCYKKMGNLFFHIPISGMNGMIIQMIKTGKLDIL